MSYLYAFLEAVSFLSGVVAALFFGNVFLPNPIAFLFIYLTVRTILFFIYFKFFLQRELPYARFSIQPILIIIVTIPVTFLITLIPFEPLRQINTVSFYYLLIPVCSYAVAFLTHRLFKLEYWVRE